MKIAYDRFTIKLQQYILESMQNHTNPYQCMQLVDNIIRILIMFSNPDHALCKEKCRTLNTLLVALNLSLSNSLAVS